MVTWLRAPIAVIIWRDSGGTLSSLVEIRQDVRLRGQHHAADNGVVRRRPRERSLGALASRHAQPVPAHQVDQFAVDSDRRGRSRAPHSRTARSTMTSNTGCTSVGELAITLRISAVAVCRSSASLVSLNRRTFSIAITAWSAKVCSRRLCCRRTGRPRRGHVMTPIGSPSCIIGTDSMLRKPRARCDVARRRLGLGVGQSATRPSTCSDAALEECIEPAIGKEVSSSCVLAGVGRGEGDEVHISPSRSETRRSQSRRQPVRARDGVEHRLHVGGRAG